MVDHGVELVLPHPRLSFQLVTRPDELSRMAPAWRDLLGDTASPSPMQSPDWGMTWWSCYGEGSGRQLRLGLFQEGDQLVGIAPLIWRRYRYRRHLSFRRLEPLGADVDEQDGVGSEYLNLIARRGYEAAVARSFACAVAGDRFGAWDEFLLSNMDGTGRMLEWLVGAFQEVGLPAVILQNMSAPFVSLPSSWEQLLAQLPAKKRYYLVRSWRDFERWAGGDARFHAVHNEAELSVGQRILRDLHQDRWQDSGHPGAFASRRFSAFHETTMHRLLREGSLELIWLEVRGQPIAALYNFSAYGKTYYYQCGRRLNLPRGIHPGAVLVIHALKNAIDRGDREFDFLADASPFKLHFTSTARPIVQFRVARPTLRESFRHTAQWALGWGRAAKRVVQTGIRLPYFGKPSG